MQSPPAQGPSSQAAGASHASPPAAPPGPAPAQAAPATGGSGGATEDEHDAQQVQRSTRHAMVGAQVAMGLGAGALAGCISLLVLAGRRPDRRRSQAGQPRPQGAY